MKARIELGYESFVLDIDDATTVARILSRAEMFKTEWHSATRSQTYHIFPRSEKTQDGFTITTISDEVYRVAKLAGKPEDKDG